MGKGKGGLHGEGDIGGIVVAEKSLDQSLGVCFGPSSTSAFGLGLCDISETLYS